MLLVFDVLLCPERVSRHFRGQAHNCVSQLVQEVERIIEAELSSWVSLPSATRSSIESNEQTARGNEHAADAAMRGVTLGQGSNSNRQPS